MCLINLRMYDIINYSIILIAFDILVLSFSLVILYITLKVLVMFFPILIFYDIWFYLAIGNASLMLFNKLLRYTCTSDCDSR